MNINKLKMIFDLADLPVTGVPRQIPNQYWPDAEAYREIALENPWWVVPVEGGRITIGWRKRVISIDWTESNRRGEITHDDVTKSTRHVHAWSVGKAVEYLSNFRYLKVVGQEDLLAEERETDSVDVAIKRLKELVKYKDLMDPNDGLEDQREAVIDLLSSYPEGLTEKFTMVTYSTSKGHLHQIDLPGLSITIGAGSPKI